MDQFTTKQQRQEYSPIVRVEYCKVVHAYTFIIIDLSLI
jgi:hypothetical protein